jgi:hypothetical protein
MGQVVVLYGLQSSARKVLRSSLFLEISCHVSMKVEEIV